MNLLLDTHLLLWAVAGSPRLSATAIGLISNEANTVWFSVVSMWEAAIKAGLGRSDFTFDARVMRRRLLQQDYREIEIRADHAFAVSNLPPIRSIGCWWRRPWRRG